MTHAKSKLALYSAGLCCAAALSLSGCVATSREMIDLRDDIAQLQATLSIVQRNQADISVKMDSVSTSMGALTEELQATQNHMSLLSQRLDDVESNINQRVGRLSEKVAPTGAASTAIEPAPSELYRMAYSDFSRGKYDVAYEGFKVYLEKYPKGELAPQAQYYMGECLYSQNDWRRALDQYDLVEKMFPRSDSVAPARLKQAQCLELLGQLRESRDVLKTIIKDFPNSQEATTARDKLNTVKLPSS